MQKCQVIFYRALNPTSPAKWHAVKCPDSTSLSAGSFELHISRAYIHLAWNRQPGGGLMELGLAHYTFMEAWGHLLSIQVTLYIPLFCS